jgi:hypothetical protein
VATVDFVAAAAVLVTPAAIVLFEPEAGRTRYAPCAGAQAAPVNAREAPALAVNMLSLTAAFGAPAWIFQGGLSGPRSWAS